MTNNVQDLEKMNQLKAAYEGIHMTREQLTAMIEVIAKAKQKKKHTQNRIFLRRSAAAAAVIAAFLLLPNTSPEVAAAMHRIPVLGAVARVFTFRSYEKETDDLKISVDIPSIELIAETTNGLTDSINQEIYELCELYSEEAVQRAIEYKEAFLKTGGTQEEWEAHQIAIKVDYEIKSQTEEFLSIAVTCTENWSSAYHEVRYYNIDIQKEQLVTLKDILGEDYINIADTAIFSQMQQREATEGKIFFTPEEGGFTGISDDAKFYINAAGNPVIVFDKYEIAPGSYGEIEFEIVQDASETAPETQEYEDNFSVDNAAVTAFAKQIKEATANQDLDALADLAAYPLYVGFEDNGVCVNSKEELIALGADKIYTAEMIDSIGNADENSLTPSKAGVVLSSDDRPNIIFGVVDGNLAIQGINY